VPKSVHAQTLQSARAISRICSPARSSMRNNRIQTLSDSPKPWLRRHAQLVPFLPGKLPLRVDNERRSRSRKPANTSPNRRRHVARNSPTLPGTPALHIHLHLFDSRCRSSSRETKCAWVSPAPATHKAQRCASRSALAHEHRHARSHELSDPYTRRSANHQSFAVFLNEIEQFHRLIVNSGLAASPRASTAHAL